MSTHERENESEREVPVDVDVGAGADADERLTPDERKAVLRMTFSTSLQAPPAGSALQFQPTMYNKWLIPAPEVRPTSDHLRGGAYATAEHRAAVLRFLTMQMPAHFHLARYFLLTSDWTPSHATVGYETLPQRAVRYGPVALRALERDLVLNGALEREAAAVEAELARWEEYMNPVYVLFELEADDGETLARCEWDYEPGQPQFKPPVPGPGETVLDVLRRFRARVAAEGPRTVRIAKKRAAHARERKKNQRHEVAFADAARAFLLRWAKRQFRAHADDWLTCPLPGATRAEQWARDAPLHARSSFRLRYWSTLDRWTRLEEDYGAVRRGGPFAVRDALACAKPDHLLQRVRAGEAWPEDVFALGALARPLYEGFPHFWADARLHTQSGPGRCLGWFCEGRAGPEAEAEAEAEAMCPLPLGWLVVQPVQTGNSLWTGSHVVGMSPSGLRMLVLTHAEWAVRRFSAVAKRRRVSMNDMPSDFLEAACALGNTGFLLLAFVRVNTWSPWYLLHLNEPNANEFADPVGPDLERALAPSAVADIRAKRASFATRHPVLRAWGARLVRAQFTPRHARCRIEAAATRLLGERALYPAIEQLLATIWDRQVRRWCLAGGVRETGTSARGEGKTLGRDWKRITRDLTQRRAGRGEKGRYEKGKGTGPGKRARDPSADADADAEAVPTKRQRTSLAPEARRDIGAEPDAASGPEPNDAPASHVFPEVMLILSFLVDFGQVPDLTLQAADQARQDAEREIIDLDAEA
jgi:hypothetical protein